MDLRIYDLDNLRRVGICDNFNSLLWTRKFYEPGEFELQAPLTSENIKLLKIGRIIGKDNSIECGIIESLETDDLENKRITAKGRFLSSILDRRLIQQTYSFNGKVEVAMRDLIGYVNALPFFVLGDLNNFEDTVTFQATMKNLLTIQEKLCKSANIGFRVKMDVNNTQLIFETYKGVDRSTSQLINKQCVFSEEYGNLYGTNYSLNSQLEKTVAIVGGEGEGSERVYVTVGSGEGFALKEIFVDAKNIKSSDFSSTEEYQNALKQKGYESLNSNAMADSFDFKTMPTGQFNYSEDYDLGDIVTINKKDWNISQNKRITEIQEIYENGGYTVDLTLGDPLPDTVDWSDD